MLLAHSRANRCIHAYSGHTLAQHWHTLLWFASGQRVHQDCMCINGSAKQSLLSDACQQYCQLKQQLLPLCGSAATVGQALVSAWHFALTVLRLTVQYGMGHAGIYYCGSTMCHSGCMHLGKRACKVRQPVRGHRSIQSAGRVCQRHSRRRCCAPKKTCMNRMISLI